MKLRFLVPILVFALSASAETAQTLSFTEEAGKVLNEAVSDRMNYLEGRYHVKFSRELFHGATFGMPPWGLPDNLAEYDPIEGYLYLNPSFTLRFLEARDNFCKQAFRGTPGLNRNAKLIRLLDHELGHILADHVSRRIGNGIWRDRRTFKLIPLHRINGSKVLSEGIAEFFGHDPLEFKRSRGANFLPVGYNEDSFWLTNQGVECAYAGGYWLVAPVLRNFGERGVAYLVTHPLDSPDSNLRRAAVEYQKKALAELGKNVKK
jgi:hypothetical protein